MVSDPTRVELIPERVTAEDPDMVSDPTRVELIPERVISGRPLWFGKKLPEISLLSNQPTMLPVLSSQSWNPTWPLIHASGDGMDGVTVKTSVDAAEVALSALSVAGKDATKYDLSVVGFTCDILTTVAGGSTL
jgi:hypothetical protein